MAAGNLLRTLTDQVSLIGIQPAVMETGFDLTPEIKDKFEDMLSRVLTKLSEWDVRVEKVSTDSLSHQRDDRSDPMSGQDPFPME